MRWVLTKHDWHYAYEYICYFSYYYSFMSMPNIYIGCCCPQQLRGEAEAELSDIDKIMFGSEVADLSSSLDSDTTHPMGLLSSVAAIMSRSVGFSRHHSARSKRAQEISDRCRTVERCVCAEMSMSEWVN